MIAPITPVQLAVLLSCLPPDDALVVAARLGADISALRHGAPWMNDYADGRWHRHNVLPEYTDLQRRRWPPTGDRDLWIKFGPDGPPPNLGSVGEAA